MSNIQVQQIRRQVPVDRVEQLKEFLATAAYSIGANRRYIVMFAKQQVHRLIGPEYYLSNLEEMELTHEFYVTGSTNPEDELFL